MGVIVGVLDKDDERAGVLDLVLVGVLVLVTDIVGVGVGV